MEWLLDTKGNDIKSSEQQARCPFRRRCILGRHVFRAILVVSPRAGIGSILSQDWVGTVQFAPVWRAVRAFFDAICDKRSPRERDAALSERHVDGPATTTTMARYHLVAEHEE